LKRSVNLHGDDIERQIDTAIAQAAMILFVVDVRAGLVPLDDRVAEARPVSDLAAARCFIG